MTINFPTDYTAWSAVQRQTSANRTQATQDAQAANNFAMGLRTSSARDTRDLATTSAMDRMRQQTREVNASLRNAQDGLLLTQGAAGALTQTDSALNRMRDLAAEASSADATAEDRASANAQFGALMDEIDRTGVASQKALFGQSTQASAQLANISLVGNSAGTVLSAENLGFGSKDNRTVDLTTAEGAAAAAQKITAAMGRVGDAQTALGTAAQGFEKNLQRAATALQNLHGVDSDPITSFEAAGNAVHTIGAGMNSAALLAQANAGSSAALWRLIG